MIEKKRFYNTRCVFVFIICLNIFFYSLLFLLISLSLIITIIIIIINDLIYKFCFIHYIQFLSLEKTTYNIQTIQNFFFSNNDDDDNYTIIIIIIIYPASRFSSVSHLFAFRFISFFFCSLQISIHI